MNSVAQSILFINLFSGLFNAFTLRMLEGLRCRRERIRDGMTIGMGEQKNGRSYGTTIMRHVPVIKQRLRSRVCK